MALTELVAFDLTIPEAAPETKQFIAPQSSLGAKVSHGLQRSLLDNGEALLKIERRQPLIVRMQVFQVESMGGLLMAFGALDNLMLDVVKVLRIRRRPIGRAPLCPMLRQLHLARDSRNIKIDEDVGRGPVWMLRLSEHGPKP